MPDAVIVSTARTPIGRAHKGTLVDVDAFDLAEHVVVAALRRSGLDPALVDDIVIAETLYGGGDIARYVAIEAGIEHVPRRRGQWNAAVEADVSREDMDAWAARSHHRAVAGIDDGSFETEIAPIEVKRADGSSARHRRREGERARERLQPRSSDRDDRCSHDRDRVRRPRAGKGALRSVGASSEALDRSEQIPVKV